MKPAKWARGLRRRAHSLRVKIVLLLIACMALALIIIGLVVHSQIRGHLLDSQINLTQATMSEHLSMLDNYYMIMMSKTDTLFFDHAMTAMLERDCGDMGVKAATLAELSRRVDSTVFNLKYPEVTASYYVGGLVDTLVYAMNDTLMPGTNKVRPFHGIEGSAWYRELTDKRRTFSWCLGESVNVGSYVAVNRLILSTGTMRPIAVLRICVARTKVHQVLAQEIGGYVQDYAYLSGDGSAVITNGAVGGMLTAPRDRAFQIRDLGGESYLVGTSTSELNGYRLVYAMPMSRVYRVIEFVTPIILLASGIGLALCVLLGLGLSKVLLRNIKVLVMKTQRIAQGEKAYECLGSVRGNDEIAVLDRSFMRMVRMVDELHEKERQYQRVLNEVRAELLQEQFNPHLLYNTLSMIRHRCQEGGQTALSEVTDNLIGFYRRVLNRGQLSCTIGDELSMIKHYLKVVQQVYELDLDVSVDVPDDILAFGSLKLFLQPIVENAILHGIRPNGAGQLSIRVRRADDGRIEIVVEDDGIGMEPGRLLEIQAILQSGADAERSSASYGYVSVVKRMSLFYGDRYQLSIDSAPGEGVTTRLLLPALSQQEMEDLAKRAEA
ncbi:MAG: histidine kinase [Clostridiales bacterium]|nr:histidine kinase [Clostridiales bacterium]